MMIELQYALSKEDLVDYNYFYNWSDSQQKTVRMNFYMKYWMTITLPTLMIAIIFNKAEFNLATFKIYFAIVLVGFCFAISTRKWGMKGQTIKTVENFEVNPLNANFFLIKKYQITSERILISDSNSAAEFKWNAIVRRAENDSAYYLFLNSQQAIVVPKRHLDFSQKERLEIIFNENIPFIADLPPTENG